MFYILRTIPENAGQVLKYLLLENGVELPEADGTCVQRKKEGIFVKAVCYYFWALII